MVSFRFSSLCAGGLLVTGDLNGYFPKEQGFCPTVEMTAYYKPFFSLSNVPGTRFRCNVLKTNNKGGSFAEFWLVRDAGECGQTSPFEMENKKKTPPTVEVGGVNKG